jgi:LysM repeat protein
MDAYQPEKKRNRARDRVAARQSRRQPMATRRAPTAHPAQSSLPVKNVAGLQTGVLMERARLFAGDLWWRTTHTPLALVSLAGLATFLLIVFVLSHVLGGRIFPNVWALGLPLGGLTVDEAAVKLETAWQRSIRITLVDGERTWEATPLDLGLAFNARATAEAARSVGMAGIPLGYGVEAMVALENELRAQTFLLDLSLQANIAASNAGFTWQDEELVVVDASDGRLLDVAATLGDLLDDPQRVVGSRRLNLVMTPVQPDRQPAEAFLDAARSLTSQQFRMTGYDPFRDQTITWSTDRDTFTSWLEATSEGLGLRAELFRPFLDAQIPSINTDGSGLRFIEPTDVIDKMRAAIRQGQAEVTVRIRYRSTTYEIEPGDTGFRISRRTGIPFFLIQQANPNLDWETTILRVGDRIQLPSRDLVLPLDPVPTKRIVINLNTQSMVAYENGQEVFSWLISSGISTAPTSPGVYQILSHQDVASGSSFTLCGERGCGQWQMYWFMGIYEVVPGLMNGFHGNVLLPNGDLLGGGNVGSPYTYGCIMSVDENARQLYEWADLGTVVEIVSNEFVPQSELGRLATDITGGI